MYIDSIKSDNVLRIAPVVKWFWHFEAFTVINRVNCAILLQMKITYDDQFLVTISEDASIILWKIQDKEGRGVKRDKEVGWAEEILITKSDLEEKNSMMAELKTRVDELKMENGYQLRLKDMNYNEKIKELTEKFIQEMESLKTKNQVKYVVHTY